MREYKLSFHGISVEELRFIRIQIHSTSSEKMELVYEVLDVISLFKLFTSSFSTSFVLVLG
jgi:hypothetical protein